MTPAARAQATVEVLDAVLAGPAAADDVLRHYFRGRRYAGSGDRRAVAAAVYDVLRARGRLEWRLAGTAPPDGRRLLLAHLADTGGDVAALFGGGPFAPAAPDPGEAALAARLAAPAEGPPPAWARANLPEHLYARFADRFGPATDAELAALTGRAAVDLRVNRLKATREAVLARLAADGIAAEPAPLAPWAVRLAGEADLSRHPLLLDGTVEVQDAGSQVLAHLVDARPGLAVLDYCAGAGGKTLALAADMAGEGRLVAADTDSRRLARAGERARRAGAEVAAFVTLDADGGGVPGGLFDRVLVDAPCTGSGTWRRAPEAPWRLAEADVDRFARRQAMLLDRAARLVAPGGRLVYGICSLFRAEGEAVVEAFLAAHADFTVLPLAEIWAPTLGGAAPGPGPHLLLRPAAHGTDGFFATVAIRAVYR